MSTIAQILKDAKAGMEKALDNTKRVLRHPDR
jgi:hypothetical protein